MKKIISLILTFAIVLSFFACSGNQSTTSAQIKVETKESENYVPTGDPIKDEASWPVGKFGYHEPPMELRNYNDPDHPDRYRIAIHSDIYGDLELKYNPKSGQRTLFTKGGSARDQLMIISEDNPISIAEALQDLKMGDSIARNFGK